MRRELEVLTRAARQRSASEVYIVAVREIGAEMATAGFLTTQRGPRDQQTDGHQACNPSRLAIRGRRVPQRLRTRAPRRQLRDGRAQAVRMPRTRPTCRHMRSRAAPASGLRGPPGVDEGIASRRPGVTRESSVPASPQPHALRRRGLRAASCWPDDWPREHRCTRPLQPRRDGREKSGRADRFPRHPSRNAQRG